MTTQIPTSLRGKMSAESRKHFRHYADQSGRHVWLNGTYVSYDDRTLTVILDGAVKHFPNATFDLFGNVVMITAQVD